MKVECQYCHNMVDAAETSCPSCGAPLPEAPKPPPEPRAKKAGSGANTRVAAAAVALVALAGAGLMLLSSVTGGGKDRAGGDKAGPEKAVSLNIADAMTRLKEDPGDVDAYRTAVAYFLQNGRPGDAYGYAEKLLLLEPGEGAWCMEQFQAGGEDRYAALCAALGDGGTGERALMGQVENLPLSVVMPQSLLAQAMELILGRSAAELTVGDLQQVTALAVDGSGIRMELGEGRSYSFIVDTAVEGSSEVNLFQGLRSLSYTSRPPEAVRIASLEELTLLRTTATEDLTGFGAMKKLTALSIGGKGFTSLEGLDKLESLTALTLVDTGLTDLSLLSARQGVTTLGLVDNTLLSGVASLANMNWLRELTVSGETVADLSPLAGLGKLAALHVEDTGVRSADFLTGMTGLEELTFTGNDGVATLPQLAALPALSKLTLESDELLDDQTVRALGGVTELELQVTKKLSFLSPMTALEKLTAYTSKSELDLSPLAAFSSLRRLSLSGTGTFYENYTVQLANLASLKNMALEELDLGGRGLYAPLDPVFQITTLRRLDISGVSAEGTDFGKLAALSGLETLVMDGFQEMRDVPPGPYDEYWSYEAAPASEYTASLGLLTGLKELSAKACGIEDVSFAASLGNLETLSLNDNGITDLSPLAGLTNLKTLRLAGNPIADYGPVEGMEGLRVIK